MARASGVTLELSFERLPFFEGLVDIAAGNRPGGLHTNQEHFSGGVAGRIGDDGYLIYDPQTSGGLLVAVGDRYAHEAEEVFEARGVTAWRIGKAIPAIPGIHIHMV